DLDRRDVRAPRDVHRPGKLHRVIGQNPLQPVVGEDRHRLLRRDTEVNQRGRQLETGGEKLPKTDRAERAVRPARAESRAIAVDVRGGPENIDQRPGGTDRGRQNHVARWTKTYRGSATGPT